MAITARLTDNAFGNSVHLRTGKVRLSFPKLFEKDQKSGKYQAGLIIPKGSDTEALLRKAIENAKEDGKTRLWGGKMQGKPKVWITDGDAPKDGEDTRPEYEGCIIVNAKSDLAPAVYDIDGSEVDGTFDRETIYPGCFVQAVIEAYPYNNDAKGISFSLLAIKKVSDGDRFGGGIRKVSADEFDTVDDEDAEDF